MANPFRGSKSTKSEEVKPTIAEPAPEMPEPVAEAPAVPKGPLDCPSCSLAMNHAGPHA